MSLRPIDLARAAGLSVQQVRNYEELGLLPETNRSASGYRQYTPQHLQALITVRHLVGGYGWHKVPTIMQAIHRQDLATALATIDSYHGKLATSRRECEETLKALRVLALSSAQPQDRQSRLWRIGEAAGQLGVRVSALYFWEQRALIQPVRESGSRYRLYDEQQMQRLRVIVLLREAGYGFTTIEAVLDELAAGRVERAIVAVEKRQKELTRMSWLCLDALSSFREYVQEFYAHLL